MVSRPGNGHRQRRVPGGGLCTDCCRVDRAGLRCGADEHATPGSIIEQSGLPKADNAPGICLTHDGHGPSRDHSKLDPGSVGYYLPELLHDIDPEGFVVPEQVAARLDVANDIDDIRRLTRIGGAYFINSAAWRVIALAALRAANAVGGDSLRVVYSGLTDRGVRTWSAAVGEVPQMFVAAVEQARKNMADETEQDLRIFWQNRLEAAEADLRDEEERAKEERGE